MKPPFGQCVIIAKRCQRWNYFWVAAYILYGVRVSFIPSLQGEKIVEFGMDQFAKYVFTFQLTHDLSKILSHYNLLYINVLSWPVWSTTCQMTV